MTKLLKITEMEQGQRQDYSTKKGSLRKKPAILFIALQSILNTSQMLLCLLIIF